MEAVGERGYGRPKNSSWVGEGLQGGGRSPGPVASADISVHVVFLVFVVLCDSGIGERHV